MERSGRRSARRRSRLHFRGADGSRSAAVTRLGRICGGDARFVFLGELRDYRETAPRPLKSTKTDNFSDRDLTLMQDRTDRPLAVLDRSRRHLHRRRRAAARRRPRHAQAAVRKSRALRRRGAPGHPRRPGPRRPARRSRPSGRRGQDGHDRRHQRAARAQGRAHGPGRSPRASATRCASAIRTGRASSPARSACPSCSTSAWSRSTSGSTPRARCCSRSIWRAPRAGLRAAYDAGIRSVAIVFMHGYRHPAHERRSRRSRARSASPRSRSRHEVSPLMKLVGRGDTTVVDAYLSPILRRYVDRVAGELGRCAAHVHAVERRPDRRALLPGQGQHPLRPGRRHRRRGAHLGHGRVRPASSASTWAAPRPTSRTMPASSSAPSRRRSRACACARR